MSELRKIKVKVDMDTILEVAQELGATVRQNDCPKSYATRTTQCELVINYKGFEFGVLDRDLIYDDMFGSKVSEFMSHYFEKILAKRGIKYRKAVTQNEYVFILS